jgi:hypothetical protein
MTQVSNKVLVLFMFGWVIAGLFVFLPLDQSTEPVVQKAQTLDIGCDDYLSVVSSDVDSDFPRIRATTGRAYMALAILGEDNGDTLFIRVMAPGKVEEALDWNATDKVSWICFDTGEQLKSFTDPLMAAKSKYKSAMLVIDPELFALYGITPPPTAES